jgi:hypothetical protein
MGYNEIKIKMETLKKYTFSANLEDAGMIAFVDPDHPASCQLW